MKTIISKVITVSVLLAFIVINSYGQASAQSSVESDKNRAKIDKTKVPKAVTETFNKEQPIKFSDSWYTYQPFVPYGWYEVSPYHYIPNPKYYAVEYAKGSSRYKTIFVENGEKIATHKAVNSIPQEISDAINKSQYKNWKIGKDKEEIFKDTDKDQFKVYKVDVINGNEKHTLYFQTSGKLLKDKK